MSYTPTVWANEVPGTTPLKYKISQSSDGDVATDATIELVTSVTAGTPVNAENMNKIEQAIADIDARLAIIEPGWIAQRLTNASWDGDSKTANTEYTVNLRSDFGIPDTAKAVWLFLDVKRSNDGYNAESRSDVYVRLLTYGQPMVWMQVRPPYYNVRASATGLVIPDSSGRITVKFGAIGITECYLEVCGYRA